MGIPLIEVSDMRICSACGLGHDNEAPRCRRCGGQLVEPDVQSPVKPPEPDQLVRFCPACMLANAASSPVCRDCGASLAKVRPVSERKALRTVSDKIIRRMYWFDTLRLPFLIACGVTAAAAVVSLILFSSPLALLALLLSALGALGRILEEAGFSDRYWYIDVDAGPNYYYYQWSAIGSLLLWFGGLIALILSWIF